MTLTGIDIDLFFTTIGWKKVLNKLKIPLSKQTILKLSTADDRDTIYQFLMSLKQAVDKREYTKLIQLENSQNYLDYIIANDDIIKVSSNL